MELSYNNQNNAIHFNERKASIIMINQKTKERLFSVGNSGISKTMYKLGFSKSQIDNMKGFKKRMLAYDFSKIHFRHDPYPEMSFVTQAAEDMRFTGFNSTGMWVDPEFYSLTQDKFYNFVCLSKYLIVKDKDTKKNKNVSLLLPDEDYKIVFTDEWVDRVRSALWAVKSQNWKISAFTIGNEVVWQRLGREVPGWDDHNKLTTWPEVVRFWERFCSVTSWIVGSIFPDVPISCGRIAGNMWKTPAQTRSQLTGPERGNELCDIAAQYCDFFTYNSYTSTDNFVKQLRNKRKTFDAISKKYKKPYIITETSWHDASLRKQWKGMRYRAFDPYPKVNATGKDYPTIDDPQYQRAEHFIKMVEEYKKSKFCVGAHWYSYLDHVDINWGMRDVVTNKRYEVFAKRLSEYFGYF